MTGPGRRGAVVRALCVAAMALTLAGCGRERRTFRPAPPQAAEPARGYRGGNLHAGLGDTTKTDTVSAEFLALEATAERNAPSLAEGKRLFAAYNCSGCHGNGGGSMGPPLIDRKWIYGSSPQDIYTTIVRGRPNGMPSFSGRIPQYQVWELVAYVRSMSGQVSKTAAPGRNDDMRDRSPENSQRTERPVLTPPPPMPDTTR